MTVDSPLPTSGVWEGPLAVGTVAASRSGTVAAEMRSGDLGVGRATVSVAGPHLPAIRLTITVPEPYRRRGIGRALLEWAAGR